MNSIDLIGLAAATFTTGCWLPQVLLIFKTRDVSAVSLLTYLGFTAGVSLWLVYGFLIESMPMIIGNFIALILSLMIVSMKLIYGRK